MSDLLNDIATSDAATDVATGTEALFRGLFPKGAFNALEVGLGGARQADIDARAASGGTVGKVAEFGGTMLRDTAAMALAGPVALFGVAALNTVTDTAQHAVNHDSQLTVEHVAGTLFDEMLNATAGVALGAVLPGAANLAGRVLSATGRAITGGVESAAGRKLASLSGGAELRQIEEAARKALDDGIYAKGRAAALEHVAVNKAELETRMQQFLSPFDETSSILPGHSPAAQELLSEAKPALDGFTLARGGKPLDASTLTPSEALELEAYLGKAAKEAQGEASQGLLGLQQRLKPKTDKLLAERGASPQELRQFQSEIAAQDAVRESIPVDAIPTLAKAAAKDGGKLAVGAGIAELASLAGVPPSMIAAGGGALAAYAGVKGALKGSVKQALPEVAEAAKAYGGQQAYRIGQVLSNFDRGIFSQYFANQFGNEVGNEVVRALQGGFAGATASTALDARRLTNLQCLAESPETLQHFAQRAVDSAPIPDDQKPQVVDTLAHAVQEFAKDLPQPNPMAPPGARSMPMRKQVALARKVQAFVDPTSVVRQPTREGLESLQRLRTATHSTILQQAINSAGPNVAPGTHARVLLDALGFDNSMKQAGRMAQQFYAPKPMPAPSQRSARHQTSTNINFHVNAATAVDNTESKEP